MSTPEKKNGSDKPAAAGSVTISLDDLNRLVEQRIAAALKKAKAGDVRHPKSPAPRIRVESGRYATSAGILEAQPESYWGELAKLLDAPDTADETREAHLSQLREHLRSMHPMDPMARRVRAFIEAREAARA